MAALGLAVATDLANAALPFHLRGKALAQTTQDKPLLAWLREHSKTFTGGSGTVTEPVQGAFMEDTAGFLQGFTEDDEVLFKQASNLLRTSASWKEVICGLIITWTELLKDDITITDDGEATEHSDVALTRLTGILENRMGDFTESQSRAYDKMFLLDGSQDSKQIAGLRSILTDTATTGTTLGLSRVTYTWWRHRLNLAVPQGPATSEMMLFFQKELVQLRRYGGRPDVAMCGSEFLDALRAELAAKGLYTQQGWSEKSSTDMGMAEINISGLGTFKYNPTFDNNGWAKRCVILDSRRLKYRPMEKEDMRPLNPDRPYNYLVFLKNVKSAGVLTANQLNCHGMYAIA